MTDLHRDNGGYTGIDVRDTADPFFDNVSLLLQPAAGDTVIEDKSPNAHSITNNGVTLDNTNQKWNGAASMLFERANGDNLELGDSPVHFLGNYDFTIETWVYVNGSTSSSQILWFHNDNNNDDYQLMRLSYESGYGLDFFEAVSQSLTVRVTSSDTVASGQWVHVSTTRQGDKFRVFQGGVLKATTTSTEFLSDRAGLDIGRGNSLSSPRALDANMTSFRVTKGVARYTATFTPPQRPFPTRRFVSGIIQP